MNDNIIITLIGAICTLIIYLLGEMDALFVSLCIFMLLDFITGFCKGYIKKCLSSRKAKLGIIKKIGLLVLVIVANIVDHISGTSIFRGMIISIILGTEGLSIIENLAIMGVPIPDKIRKALEALSKG